MSGSRTEDPLRGIAFSVSATVLFATSDMLAKVLSARVPVIEIAWIRYVLFVGFAASLAWRTSSRERTRVWAVRSPTLQIGRGLLVVGSGLLFILGVRQMALAQATSISFVAPMLVTMLSIPVLGEKIGVRRWAAVGVGMLGMLIIVRPGISGVPPAALFALASAACWAGALVITRKMATTERPATTLLWTAGTGFVLLSAMMPFAAAWPSFTDVGLALILGSCASAGQWLVVLAHRQAPASVLAPFTYVQLLWSTTYGFLVFAAVPDRWTLVGAAVIIASGLYTAHRERVRGAERRAS